MNEEIFSRTINTDEIYKALTYIPPYDGSIRNGDETERLIALSDIYKLYLPSSMSKEIYLRFYTAIKMAIAKKKSSIISRQQQENFAGMQSGNYRGIIGGADSFTIIGESGIGKSSAIERAINIITNGRIIETEKPYAKIIPCVVVQCPFDCSAKGMLLEILRVVDSNIGTNYYLSSQRASITTDILIGTVSSVCINHIGLLIIDEIQNVACHKGGMNFVNMMTQIINNSGISIGMVGVPESISFFEQSLRLARRSIGLRYDVLPFDDYFIRFCKLIFEFQYVKEKSEIDDTIIQWLYSHSKGIISVVVSLIHDAQEIAIITGSEKLDIEALEEAFKKRMGLLHAYIAPKRITINNRKRPKANIIQREPKLDEDVAYETIPFIVQQAKNEGLDIIAELKKQISIEEVQV